MLGILATLISGIGGKLLGKAAGKACDVVDQLVEDKDLAAQIKSQLTSKVMDIDVTKYVAQIEAQKSVLIAEIQGESWMQRNWRPIVMMVFTAIIANNYIIFPYLSLFDSTQGAVTMLTLPDFMWDCLKLGLSGYIVGRSCEKIANGSGIKGAVSKIMNGS